MKPCQGAIILCYRTCEALLWVELSYVTGHVKPCQGAIILCYRTCEALLWVELSYVTGHDMMSMR